MTLSRLSALALLAICSALPLHASGKKGEAMGVSFHVQADPTDSQKMIFAQDTNGKKVLYKRLPEVRTKDIAAFMPFPSRDGEGFGVVLQLKSSPKSRYAAVTGTNINRWMVAMVNGRVVDAVIIDKQIDDGMVVIWKGIGNAEIEALDALIPRIGEAKPRR